MTHVEEAKEANESALAVAGVPANFFEVESLHCSHERTFLRSHYALHEVQANMPDGLKSLTGLGKLRPLIDTESQTTVFCDANDCALLMAPRADVSTDKWRMASLESVGGHVDALMPVPFPRNWRIAAGAWKVRTNQTSRISVAGWDGDSIVVGSLERKAINREWKLHRSFKLQLDAKYCGIRATVCPYKDVRALHLNDNGNILLLLSRGGLLDGWDIQDGTFLGRYRLKGNYLAMCHDGSHALLARRDRSGPVFVSVQLPAELTGRRIHGRSAAFLEV